MVENSSYEQYLSRRETVRGTVAILGLTSVVIILDPGIEICACYGHDSTGNRKRRLVVGPIPQVLPLMLAL